MVAEIAAGILIGATAGLGSGSLHRLLPRLKFIGEAGLILILVTYEIRAGLTRNASAGHRRKAVAAIAVPQGAGLPSRVGPRGRPPGCGYLGSRLCGRTRESLQAGYSAAILTASLHSALVIPALVTTMLTVPLLSAIDRWYGRSVAYPCLRATAPSERESHRGAE